jgi:hypothetical protein
VCRASCIVTLGLLNMLVPIRGWRVGSSSMCILEAAACVFCVPFWDRHVARHVPTALDADNCLFDRMLQQQLPIAHHLCISPAAAPKRRHHHTSTVEWVARRTEASGRRRCNDRAQARRPGAV